MLVTPLRESRPRLIERWRGSRETVVMIVGYRQIVGEMRMRLLDRMEIRLLPLLMVVLLLLLVVLVLVVMLMRMVVHRSEALKILFLRTPAVLLVLLLLAQLLQLHLLLLVQLARVMMCLRAA